jgi:thioredoxin 1
VGLNLQNLVDEVEKLVEAKLRILEREFADPVVYLDAANFDKTISSGKLVVVNFSAQWCVPCKAYLPVFKLVARKFYGDQRVVFAYLDTDANSEIADRYRIDNIPSTVFFYNGQVVDIVVGVMQEHKLEEKVRALLKEIEG